MRANVFRLPMRHPGDLSELEGLIAQDTLRADEIVAEARALLVTLPAA